MRNRKIFCFCWLFIISFFAAIIPASAQKESDKGLMFITKYTPKMYNGSGANWSVIQGNDGIMYFGQTNTASNIIQYDGVKWQRIPAPVSSVICRCLAKDKEGTIFYGGSNDFGYLDKDSIGRTCEHSLLQYVPKDKQSFGDVWSIGVADNSVYFQSRERLFRLTKEGEGNNVKWLTKTWEPSTHFMYSFYLDGVLYVHEQGVGLLKMINDVLTLIPGSEFLGKDRMQVMLPYFNDNKQENSSQQKQYLCGTFTQGIYIFDGKNFKPFETEADSFKKQYILYKCIRINGNYALAYFGAGIVIINPQGKIVQVINTNSGLSSNVVSGIYATPHGDIWLAQENGIAKININSPFTSFNEQSGIVSPPLAMARLQDGSLFVGTNNGLLKFNPATSKFDVNTVMPRNQIFALVADGNTLLVPGDGLYMIKNGKTILVQPSVNNNLKIAGLIISKKYPNLMYAATTFGVCLFYRNPTTPSGWQYLGYLPGIKDEMYFFTEEDNGNMWVCSNNGSPYRITPAFDDNGKPDLMKSKVENFGPKNNLNFPISYVFPLNHQAYFLDANLNTYHYNDKTNKFEKSSFENLSNYSGVADSTGKIWLLSGTADNFKLYIATPNGNNSYRLDSNSLLPIIDRISPQTIIYPEANGIVWFSGIDNIVRYDEKIKNNIDTSYKVLITAITAEKQNLNPGITASNQPEIKFNSNSLHFDYAAPFFEQENKTEYQTWLEGFENTWSDWGKNTYKEYTNLSAGKYTFHVRAKNIYHTISNEATYSFTILPPWYGAWWAYLLYAVIAVLIVYFFVSWRTRQLKEKHAALEKTVEERTHQLSQRVEELAVINSVQEALVSQIDMQGIYDLVGERIRKVFDAQVVGIATLNLKNNTEQFKYVIEKGERFYPADRKFDQLRQQLVASREKILIQNKTEAYTWFKKEVVTGEPMQSGMFIPLLVGEKITGYITLQNVDHENAFSDSDVRLLETLANSMSVALENARLFDETNRLLKETEQRTAELGVINSVQDGLAKELDMQGIYNLVGDRLQQLFNAQAVVIASFNTATKTENFNYVFENGEKFELTSRPINEMRQHIIDKRDTIYIETEETAKTQFGITALGDTKMPKSLLFVPLLSGNDVKGYVSLQNIDTEHAFSEPDVRLLETLANSMSVALENARLFDETNRLLKETEQKTAELGVINSVQDGLVREMNIQSIYELVGNRICQLFDTQTVIIRTFNHDTGNEEWQFALERGVRLHSEPRPFIWANKELIKTKQPILINKNYVQFSLQHGGTGSTKGLPPKSAIFVPMLVGDVVRGSVSLQNVEKEDAFNENDLRLLSTLTNSMSVALENARLFDETTHLLADAKQRASELATVNSISNALATQLNPDELIQLVGDQMKNLFRANIVYVALLNKKTKFINFVYQYGEAMPSRKIGDGLTSKIILTGKPLLINKDLTTKHEELKISQIGLPASSYLGVPIPVGDEIVGVLSVQSTERENRFTENDLRLLNTIASSVGISLKNAQLFEVAEQAKMQAELASKTAEKANEAKSAFLSTVSHELRTPLTSVLGFAKIIKKRLEEKIFTALNPSDSKLQKTTEQVSENLNVVISEGERLTHLINDVLDLAKIEAGKMEWNQENVSLAEVIERAVAATTSLFEQKNIQLIKEIDTDIPSITGDTDKLIQVVINLFSNAVKFTDKGSVTCKLYHQNNEAIVSVTDTGIGIAKEDYGAVFEQFKQVGGDTLTDKPKGTGLGLPICKEIVEHHGGHIWVESEMGKGSTFAFAIPVVAAIQKNRETPIHLSELMKQLKEQMVVSKFQMVGKNATILVVDDDDSIRSLLQQELSDAGYFVEEAKDGKLALESIRKNRPDLIILDVMMPEINGFDVAAILKNDPQTMDIPIIILSIVQDKARGFRIGVDRYLTKPIDTEKLFAEVGNLLEQGKSKKKVLVVDEDSSAVRSLTEVLQTKGYIVVESNGKELVEQAVSTQPDIIILNSVLSDKNEIVQTLRFEKGLENVLFLIYQ